MSVNRLACGTSCALGALFSLLAVTSSPAAVSYRYDTGADEHPALPNEAINIPIYIVEQVSNGSSSRLVEESGLFAASALVDRDANLPTSPSQITAFAANAIDFPDPPIITPAPPGPTSVNFNVFESAFATSGPTGSQISPSQRRVLLGTVTILAGSELDESTHFTIGDDPAFLGTFTIDSPNALDGLIETSVFSVVVVPEPASVVVVLSAITWAAVRRRRE